MDASIDGLGRLTTEHAASSYGQAVLVIDGAAHGPGDVVTVTVETTTAAEAVRGWLWFNRGQLSEEELELAQAFVALGQATRGV